LQISASLAVLSEAFLPFTSKKLANMLNLEPRTWSEAGAADMLPVGHQIREAILLFEKIEDQQIQIQLDKLANSKKMNEVANFTPAPSKDNISFDDFSAMDIRVGTILEAEHVPKTKKLLKLTIDTGIDRRTVVSGIAEYFAPEKIIGQQVSILVNLAPREIKGILSQGMILMAENADGSLHFVQPTTAIQNGSSVK
jgi:methionyl-tRNA synthetase